MSGPSSSASAAFVRRALNTPIGTASCGASRLAAAGLDDAATPIPPTTAVIFSSPLMPASPMPRAEADHRDEPVPLQGPQAARTEFTYPTRSTWRRWVLSYCRPYEAPRQDFRHSGSRGASLLGLLSCTGERLSAIRRGLFEGRFREQRDICPGGALPRPIGRGAGGRCSARVWRLLDLRPPPRFGVAALWDLDTGGGFLWSDTACRPQGVLWRGRCGR